MDTRTRNFNLQRLVVLISLIAVIALQKHILLGKFAWLAIALLCGINVDFAVYAIYFFAAFFNGVGYFPKLFFTLKHLHIALILLIGIHLLKGNLWSKTFRNAKKSFSLTLWIAILVISTLSALMGIGGKGQVLRVLMTNANILSLVFAAFVLVCLIERKELILNSLLFFVFGVSLRVILGAAANHHLPYLPTEEPLLFNNHIGFLSCFSLFILLPFLITKQGIARRIICWFLLILIFSGLLLSYSRTGWFSFLILYPIFFLWLRKIKINPANPRSGQQYIGYLAVTFLTFLVILIAGILLDQEILPRLYIFKKLLDPQYLYYTLHDKQNFGSLGIHRLAQFSVLGHIFARHWLVGTGFTHEVFDFHSLYLTVLGGTGLVGLSLFFIFCILWFQKLMVASFRTIDNLNVFRIGILFATLVWLFYSFFETFLVQFNMWIIIATGMLMSESLEKRGASEEEL